VLGQPYCDVGVASVDDLVEILLEVAAYVVAAFSRSEQVRGRQLAIEVG
jgi:hypothetical protein